MKEEQKEEGQNLEKPQTLDDLLKNPGDWQVVAIISPEGERHPIKNKERKEEKEEEQRDAMLFWDGFEEERRKERGDAILFWTCIAFLLIIGIVTKYTNFFNFLFYDYDWHWYYILLVPILVIIGLIMQVVPIMYIKTKLKEWGMFEDKAGGIAVIFWYFCLLFWVFVFIGKYF